MKEVKRKIISLLSLEYEMDVLSFEVTLPAPISASAADVSEMHRVIPEMITLLFKHQTLRRKERQAEMVDLLLKDVPMRPIDKRVAQLQAHALERVFTGTQWLTAEQVGELGGHGTANRAAAAQRWKEKGLLFALRRDRRDMYPRYLFADNFTPLPAIREILATFGNTSPDRIAAWFESTSSFLDGQRPRELIATHPQRVIAAANDTIHAERTPA